MYFNNIFELLLIINYYCCGAVYGNHFFNVSDTLYHLVVCEYLL